MRFPVYFSGVSTPTKDEVKAWLKAYNHSREWLGQQCGGVSKRAVDNWLSSPRDIPDGTLTLIRRLMDDDQREEAERLRKTNPTNQLFSVEVDLHRYRAYCCAALAARLTLEDWVRLECDKAAQSNQVHSGKANGTTGP